MVAGPVRRVRWGHPFVRFCECDPASLQQVHTGASRPGCRERLRGSTRASLNTCSHRRSRVLTLVFTTCTPRHCVLVLRVVESFGGGCRQGRGLHFTTSSNLACFLSQRCALDCLDPTLRGSRPRCNYPKTLTVNHCILNSEDLEVVGALYGPSGECRNLDCQRHNGTSVLGSWVSLGFRWNHRRWCVAQFCVLRVSRFLCLRGPESIFYVAGIFTNSASLPPFGFLRTLVRAQWKLGKRERDGSL